MASAALSPAAIAERVQFRLLGVDVITNLSAFWYRYCFGTLAAGAGEEGAELVVRGLPNTIGMRS